jgi:hypothetical protein
VIFTFEDLAESAFDYSLGRINEFGRNLVMSMSFFQCNADKDYLFWPRLL